MGGLYLARRLVGTVDTMSYINVGNPCVHIESLRTPNISSTIIEKLPSISHLGAGDVLQQQIGLRRQGEHSFAGGFPAYPWVPSLGPSLGPLAPSLRCVFTPSCKVVHGSGRQIAPIFGIATPTRRSSTVCVNTVNNNHAAQSTAVQPCAQDSYILSKVGSYTFRNYRY
jgi:hypothetical protein